MKLTIITATYNAKGKIQKTLESVSKQTYRDYEVIIMDGCSQDTTIIEAEHYHNKIENLRIYCEPDKGVYDAMNKGIKLAKGEFIYFLNAGDILYSDDVFENIYKDLNSINLVYGNAYSYDEYGNVIVYREGCFDKYRLAKTNLCHQTVFYPAVLLKQYNFELKYKLFADWALNMCLWKKTKPIHKNIFVTLYENGGISATQRDALFESRQLLLIYNYLGLDVLLKLFVKKLNIWK